MPLLKWMWRALRGVLLVLAAVVLFIEEWGWQPLAAWAGRLATWPPVAWLEARIRRASPRVALALFMVPGVALFPIKLLALWHVEQGRVATGLAVIVAAKLIGTALVGRLFVLVEPQLMRFGWFARALGWWRATRVRIAAAVTGSRGWRGLRVAWWRGRRWWRGLVLRTNRRP